MLEYDSITTTCRIDNADGDRNWLRGDTNGNGVNDEDEGVFTPVDFSDMAGYSTAPESQSAWPQNGPSAIISGDTFVFTMHSPELAGTSEVFFLGSHVTSGDGIIDDFYKSPSQAIVHYVDLGDLYTFNISFDTTELRRLATYQSIGIAKTLRYDSDEETLRDSCPHHGFRQVAAVSLGTRYSRICTRHTLSGISGASGSIFNDTHVDDFAIGPEIGLSWQTTYKQ